MITVSAAYSGTIIRGKGGADTIALTELSAATVAGNAGKDKITLADYNSGAVIQGGQVVIPSSSLAPTQRLQLQWLLVAAMTPSPFLLRLTPAL